MIPSNTRSASAALDAARSVIARLDVASHPDDVAADLIESWSAVETALRSLLGGSGLTGQALVSEVRQRGQLDYAHAHALLGFLAARDRVSRTDYRPTDIDTDAARAGFQAVESALGAGVAVDAGAYPTGSASRGGIGIPPVVTPSPPRPTGSTGPFSVGGSARPGAAPAAAPVAYEEVGVVGPRRSGLPLILGVVALLLVLLGGGYWAWARRTSALDEGIAAFSAGNRVVARRAFEQAATDEPKLAIPHVYLGRMARADADLPRAFNELRTAVTLEPTNALALREMGQYLLQANQPGQAVTWFKRALEADPSDRVAQGWMGCALTRQGQADIAGRFFQRAGAGDWSACQQVAPAYPAGAAPLGTVPAGAPAAGAPRP